MMCATSSKAAGVFLALVVGVLQVGSVGLNDLIGGQPAPQPFAVNCEQCCKGTNYFGCPGILTCITQPPPGQYKCMSGSTEGDCVVSGETCNAQNAHCFWSQEAACSANWLRNSHILSRILAPQVEANHAHAT